MEVELSLLPHLAFDYKAISLSAHHKLGFPPKKYHCEVLKRSIDARKKPIIFRLLVKLSNEASELTVNFQYKNCSDAKHIVYIIGAGPAGLFAGLKALEKGIKPIIIERGKDIRSRRKDLAEINKKGIVNPESNYCFGEGGAGTYSDGKLYTRSKKRGSVQEVLLKLVQHGADKDILINTHPHIGTNKLPALIENIRNTILQNGGEIRFETKLIDIEVDQETVSSIKLSDGSRIRVDNVILATGHSARDIYSLLFQRNIAIEFKPFALGVRIEHSQQLIDKIQYKLDDRGAYLPPAAYSLVHNTNQRGVYSFCMCPGGIIAPCATAEEEVVTNGWSPSKRNNPYANSGIVTEVRWEDISTFHRYGPLAGMMFQASVERNCWIEAGRSQKVPAQRLIDFLNNRKSASLPKTSYFPGLHSANLNEVFPDFITKALREGFLAFGKKMKGFLTNDAVLHATESRTSSPVRIPRNKETFEHISVKGLYPAAEGAGYAGGIVSAAIDGQNCMEAIADKIQKNTYAENL